nr:flagellar motor protein MotB [Bosea sp. RAC05]
MARKKRGGHGGHGWFVTFADLMALLMSFFVMVAAYSSQDTAKLQIVAGSMRDAFGNQRDMRLAGIVEADGIPTGNHVKNSRLLPLDQATDQPGPIKKAPQDDGLNMPTQDRGFALAAASLRQALRDMPEIAEVSRNILIEVNETGLDIQLVDQEGRAMFAEGKSQPTERMRKVLATLAPTLRRMPNKIAITGHTVPCSPRARASPPSACARSSPRWHRRCGACPTRSPSPATPCHPGRAARRRAIRGSCRSPAPPPCARSCRIRGCRATASRWCPERATPSRWSRTTPICPITAASASCSRPIRRRCPPASSPEAASHGARMSAQ